MVSAPEANIEEIIREVPANMLDVGYSTLKFDIVYEHLCHSRG